MFESKNMNTLCNLEFNDRLTKTYFWTIFNNCINYDSFRASDYKIVGNHLPPALESLNFLKYMLSFSLFPIFLFEYIVFRCLVCL